MPQSLIVDDANIDVRRELLPGYSRVHRFVTIIIVPCGQKLLAEVVDGGVLFSESEPGSVSNVNKTIDRRT